MLLFALTGPILATYTIIRIRREMVRSEVREEVTKGIPRENLVLIRVARTDMEKEVLWKDDHEFEYHGEMYDIVESETEGDTLVFWCLPDHKETSLNIRISELLGRRLMNNQQQRNDQKRMAGLLKLQFTKPSHHLITIPEVASRRLSGHLISYRSRTVPPPSPPPETA